MRALFDNVSEKGVDLESTSANASRKSSLPGLPVLPQTQPHTHPYTGTSPLKQSQSRASRVSEVYGRDVVAEAAGLNAVGPAGVGAGDVSATWEKDGRAGSNGDGKEAVGGEPFATDEEARRAEELPRMPKARIVALAITMLLTFFMSVSLVSYCAVDVEQWSRNAVGGGKAA